MAGELQAVARSGQTVYAVLRDAASQVWNGTAFEVFTLSHYSLYPIPLVEQGGTGYFVGSAPSSVVATAGWSYVAYAQNGLAPAAGDPAVSLGAAVRALTDLDDAAIIADVLTALGGPTIVQYLPLLKNLLPTSAYFKASTLSPIPVPFVPRTDITFTKDFDGFDPGTTFTDVWMGLRVGSPAAPIAGVPDRHITPSTSMESVGQILVPGVQAPNGTSSVKLGFHWTRAETALVAPGTQMSYFITAKVAGSGDIMELAQGGWSAVTGGTDR